MVNHSIALAATGVPQRQDTRPFGPLPRGLVAGYGIALAGAGATLSRQADAVDVYRCVGVGSALAGAGCALLAVFAARSRRPASEEAAEPDDVARLAAQFAAEIAELEGLLGQVPEPRPKPRVNRCTSARFRSFARPSGSYVGGRGPAELLLQFSRSVVVATRGNSALQD